MKIRSYDCNILSIVDVFVYLVWIKRDDMNGIALGGNKVRKLQYLLADAKNKGYSRTYGADGEGA